MEHKTSKVIDSFTNHLAGLEEQNREYKEIIERDIALSEADISRLERINHTYANAMNEEGKVSNRKILNSTMLYDIKWLVEKLEYINGRTTPIGKQ